MSEFDPKTTALLDRLAPAIDGRPGGVGRRRQALRARAAVEADATPALVLALAVAALAAATAAGGVHGLVTRYFPGEGRHGSARHPAGVQADPEPEHHRRRS